MSGRRQVPSSAGYGVGDLVGTGVGAAVGVAVGAVIRVKTCVSLYRVYGL